MSKISEKVAFLKCLQRIHFLKPISFTKQPLTPSTLLLQLIGFVDELCLTFITFDISLCDIFFGKFHCLIMPSSILKLLGLNQY